VRPARVWLGAFACFFGLAGTWALASPLFSVPDEPAHLVKAAAVARGQLTGRKVPVHDEGEGSIFRGGFTTVVDVPYSYTWQTSRIPNCFIYEPTVAAGCAPEFRDRPRDATWTTWVGQYPPTYYAAVGWVTRLDTGQLGVYLTRLLSAALSAAFLATAFTCARTTDRHSPLALGVVLAATPTALFLAGSVNPNGLEVAAAVCVWAALGAIVTARDRAGTAWPFAAVLVAGLVLAWTRPLSAAWLAAAVAVLLVVSGAPGDLLRRVGRGRVMLAAAAFGLVTVLATTWTVALDALGNVEGDEPRGLGLVDAFRHSLGRLGRYLEEMVGVFGWRSTFPPDWLAWCWYGAALALLGVALRIGTARVRIVLVGLVGIVLVGPSVLEAAQAADHGFAWQGRYGLPLSAGVPVVASLAVVTGRPLAARARRLLTVGIVVVVTIGHLIAHVASMRRYVVGTDGPWWYLSRDGWDPPVPAAVLLVVTVVAASGLAVLTRCVVEGVARAEAVPAPRPDPVTVTG
jgi:hypothetical protein